MDHKNHISWFTSVTSLYIEGTAWDLFSFIRWSSSSTWSSNLTSSFRQYEYNLRWVGMWHVLQCSWPQQCWDIVNNALTGSKLSLQSKDNTVDYKEDFNVYMSVNRRKPGTDGAFSQRKALTPCAVLDLCLVHCGKSTVNRWKMYCHCFWSRTSLITDS